MEVLRNIQGGAQYNVQYVRLTGANTSSLPTSSDSPSSNSDAVQIDIPYLSNKLRDSNKDGTFDARDVIADYALIANKFRDEVHQSIQHYGAKKPEQVIDIYRKVAKTTSPEKDEATETKNNTDEKSESKADSKNEPAAKKEPKVDSTLTAISVSA